MKMQFFKFMRYCADRDIENVKKLISLPDFDTQWCIHKAEGCYSPLYYACMCGHPDIVELLLNYVDVIPIKCLQTACMPVHERIDDFLKTVELLLFKHGKFDNTVKYYSLPDLDKPTDFDKQLVSLFNEYTFRLDGPKYNENMI